MEASPAKPTSPTGWYRDSPSPARSSAHPLGDSRRCTMKRLPYPVAALLLLVSSLAHAGGDPMRLVGSVAPIPDGVYSGVVVDEVRGVAYMGSAFAGNGVSVIDMRDRAHPILVQMLPIPGVIDANNRTEAF